MAEGEMKEDRIQKDAHSIREEIIYHLPKVGLGSENDSALNTIIELLGRLADSQSGPLPRMICKTTH
jgi:hypothetical protein